jgi:hypothetical protein
LEGPEDADILARIAAVAAHLERSGGVLGTAPGGETIPRGGAARAGGGSADPLAPRMSPWKRRGRS